MELEQKIEIGDMGGNGYAVVEKCDFKINETFSGYRLNFDLRVVSYDRNEKELAFLSDLDIDLYYKSSHNGSLLGKMSSALESRGRELTPNSKFTISKFYQIDTDDLIRLIDLAHGKDMIFSFDVAPMLYKSKHQPQRNTGKVRIPRSDWLERVNQLGLDRFELISIRVPVASSHLHAPFATAVEKIREAERLYLRGDWHGAAAACRAAWNTVLSSVPAGTTRDKRLEHLLATVTGDARRKEFAQAVLRGFNDVVNKGVHLEGDVKTGTPPAELKPEDVLLCIHWYTAAIGYLSSI